MHVAMRCRVESIDNKFRVPKDLNPITVLLQCKYEKVSETISSEKLLVPLPKSILSL